MNTTEILAILKDNNISPNKKLGQNFLCNESIIDKIIEVSQINDNDNILEIGPGLGILTQKLTNHANSVTAIEIDSGLYNILKQRLSDIKNVNIIHNDFLKCDLKESFTKTISNLPYYCSSEILFILAQRYGISEVYVMLQNEMADRIIAKPGTSEYGALTVTLGLYYDTQKLFKINKQSFYPQPDVSSVFIKLAKKENILSKNETEVFHNIVKSAFWGRRKTLQKALSESPHLKLGKELLEDIFRKLNIDGRIRGENLSTDDYIRIAKSYNP